MGLTVEKIQEATKLSLERIKQLAADKDWFFVGCILSFLKLYFFYFMIGGICQWCILSTQNANVTLVNFLLSVKNVIIAKKIVRAQLCNVTIIEDNLKTMKKKDFLTINWGEIDMGISNADFEKMYT